MTISHSNIAPADVHVPYSFLYADATARGAASGLVAGDIGKLARQLDDNSLWMLTAVTPSITWQAVGGGALTGDIYASQILNVVNGTLTATDVQGALYQLEADKAPRSHSHNWDSIENNEFVTLPVLMGNKIETSLMGVADGVATLASDGKLVITQLPALSITDTSLVASEAAMLALTAQTGDVAVRTDLSKCFILKGDTASNITHWEWLQSPTDAVASDIPYTPTGDLTAATLQAAVDELEANKISISQRGVLGGIATLDPVTGMVEQLPVAEDPNAANIAYTPTVETDFTSYNSALPYFVQAALDELGARKATTIIYEGTTTIEEAITVNKNDITTINNTIADHTAAIADNTAAIDALATNATELEFTPVVANDWTTAPDNVTAALGELAARKAATIKYTPSDGGNWTDPDPENIGSALDQLAIAVAAIPSDAAYTPAAPANWGGTAPTSIGAAMDRIAALLITHIGITEIPE